MTTSQRPPSRRCTATTAKGQPCRCWAVHGSDPPRCASHGGGAHPTGAPENNTNRQTHGAYSHPLQGPVDLAQRIADLNQRIIRLSVYIDDAQVGDDEGEIPLADYIRLNSLYGQLTSRLGRLLKDQQSIQGDESTELQQAMEEALQHAGEVLGVQL